MPCLLDTIFLDSYNNLTVSIQVSADKHLLFYYKGVPMKKTVTNQRTLLYCFIFIGIGVLLYTAFQNKRHPNSEPITDTQFALNTVITITLYDSTDTSILDGAFALCNHYETVFSRTLKTSELYQLNHSSKSVHTISNDLAELIQSGLKYSQLSNGAFDISIAPVSSLWDFTAEAPVIPDAGRIMQALSFVGYDQFTLDGNTITKKDSNDALDLGAIAKGFIADRIKEYLLAHDVHSALINLGGNILCVGNKNGEDFTIGIQAPFKDRNMTLDSLSLSDKSVVTSGIYERYFVKGDTLYHHILNPATGYPYENDLSSVTIISAKSVDGDALSTMCFALGLEKGMDYINEHEEFDAIFVTREGEIYYSKNLNK